MSRLSTSNRSESSGTILHRTVINMGSLLTSSACRTEAFGTSLVGDDFPTHRLGFQAPLPLVLKGRHLRDTKQLKSRRAGLRALRYILLEKHVVAGAGVEGRVKVNQVNAGVSDVLTKNIQIVAKIELILFIHLRRACHNLRGIGAVYRTWRGAYIKTNVCGTRDWMGSV